MTVRRSPVNRPYHHPDGPNGPFRGIVLWVGFLLCLVIVLALWCV